MTCTARDDAASHDCWCYHNSGQPSAHCGSNCSRPDNEVDAGHARVEEDDAVDYESNGLPESIKGTACLNLDVDVPLIGGCSIQAIHRHSNHSCTAHRVSTTDLQLHDVHIIGTFLS